MSVSTLAERIAATKASVAVQEVTWLVPAVQSVHLFAIAVIFTSALVIDLRLLGFAAQQSTVAETVRRLAPWLWWSLLVLAVSGAVLVLAEPARELPNPTFQLKMVLVFLVGALTAIVSKRLRRDEHAWDGPRRAVLGKLVGASSLTLWIGIVAAGRWIAYIQELLS